MNNCIGVRLVGEQELEGAGPHNDIPANEWAARTPFPMFSNGIVAAFPTIQR
jgi:hypothetical protein